MSCAYIIHSACRVYNSKYAPDEMSKMHASTRIWRSIILEKERRSSSSSKEETIKNKGAGLFLGM